MTEINQEIIKGLIRQALGIPGDNAGGQMYGAEGGGLGILGSLIFLGQEPYSIRGNLLYFSIWRPEFY